jgi:hypothetical protein
VERGFWYQLSSCCRTNENHENLCRAGRSQDLPDAHRLLASSPAFEYRSRNGSPYCAVALLEMTYGSVVERCTLFGWRATNCFSTSEVYCTFPYEAKHLLAPGQLSRYSDSLRARRSRDRVPVGGETDPEAHPASCAMGTGYNPDSQRTERGAHHPPPVGAGLQMVWRHNFASPLCWRWPVMG